jgi:hypothetical protein
MTHRECQYCPHVVRVGKNIKCGKVEPPEFPHLLLACPPDEEKK